MNIKAILDLAPPTRWLLWLLLLNCVSSFWSLLCLYKFLKGSKVVSPHSVCERKFQAWIFERIVPPRAAGFNSDLSEMDKYWVWGQSSHMEARVDGLSTGQSTASKWFPASSHNPKPCTDRRCRSRCLWTMQCYSSPKPNFQTEWRETNGLQQK